VKVHPKSEEDAKKQMWAEFESKLVAQDDFYKLVHVDIVAYKLAYTLNSYIIYT